MMHCKTLDDQENRVPSQDWSIDEDDGHTMKVMSPNTEVHPSASSGDGGSKKFGPSSWLTGLGLGAGSPPRLRGLSISSPGRAIADDIRNDQELLFADDKPPSPSPPMPASQPTSRRSSLTNSIGLPAHSRRSSLAGSVGLPRRSSQQKMKNLQQEVDMALEYFSMETEHELDECDGDDYLTHREKYMRVEDRGSGRRRSSADPGECDESLPSAAPTSMATSVVTDYDTEYSECPTKFHSSEQSSSISEPQTPRMSGANGPAESSLGGLSLKHKTKSILSLPLSLLKNSNSLGNCLDEEDEKFDDMIARELSRMSLAEEQEEGRKRRVNFNSNPSLRNAMEPFLAVARIGREEKRQEVFDILDKVMLPQEPHKAAIRRASMGSDYGVHIGSTYGVPYPALRSESSFLYDVESFPLGEVLAETLGVDDLSKIHIDNPLVKDKARLMAPLQNRSRRRKFHQCFDSFVTSQVIPLLHSQALSNGVFYTNRHQLQRGRPQGIVYRYQAFPSINIVRPGECTADPHCDMSQGHTIGNISYHIPLTATYGTNALYTESRPGREDWHPLATSSPGLGFQFDGARCIHFGLKNDTEITRVSLTFRIAIARVPCGEVAYDPDDQLCCPELLRDDFATDGFYDEVVVNVGDIPRSFMPGPVAVKRRGGISVVG